MTAGASAIDNWRPSKHSQLRCTSLYGRERRASVKTANSRDENRTEFNLIYAAVNLKRKFG